MFINLHLPNANGDLIALCVLLSFYASLLYHSTCIYLLVDQLRYIQKGDSISDFHKHNKFEYLSWNVNHPYYLNLKVAKNV